MLSTTDSRSVLSEIKSTFSLGIPLIASQLIYASSSFIGTIMVAHLGQDALAASVLVSMVWLSLSVLFFGILNSISVLIAHQYGAKNNQAISDIMSQAFMLGIIISIIILATLSTVPFFLKYSGQPAPVLVLANQYVFSLLWTIPALVLLIILEQFLAGIHRTKLVLRISLLIVPLEVPLIYMLIFGKFGLPACGVAGIGYGFALSYTFTAICLTFYLVKSKHYDAFQIFNNLFKIDLTYLKELVILGLPIGFMNCIELTTFAVATFWMSQFGTTMLAAHQLVIQYLSFSITLVFAMSQAVTIRVGHFIGAQNISAIRLAVYVGMFLNFAFICCVSLGFYLFPNFFLGLDINIHDPANQLLLRDATALLAICGALLLFDNFRIIGLGALRGLKQTGFAMYASFVSFWLVGLSAAYLLGFKLRIEGQGIWWGLTIGIAFGAAMVLIRLHFSLKKLMSQPIN